jgi:hypothetical protein
MMMINGENDHEFYDLVASIALNIWNPLGPASCRQKKTISFPQNQFILLNSSVSSGLFQARYLPLLVQNLNSSSLSCERVLQMLLEKN